MEPIKKDELVQLLESLPEGNESWGIRIKWWSAKWQRFGIVELAVENPREAAKDSLALTDLLQQVDTAFKHFEEIGPPPEMPDGAMWEGHIWEEEK